MSWEDFPVWTDLSGTHSLCIQFLQVTKAPPTKPFLPFFSCWQNKEKKNTYLPLCRGIKPLCRPKVTHRNLNWVVWNILALRFKVHLVSRVEGAENWKLKTCVWDGRRRGAFGGNRGLSAPDFQRRLGRNESRRVNNLQRLSFTNRMSLSVTHHSTCQAAVGRQECWREATVGKSLSRPSLPRSWNQVVILLH